MDFGRLALTTVFLAAFACFLFSSGFASALTNVTACGVTLSTANETYALNQSLTGGAGNCITITGANSTLDCNYYGRQYNISGAYAGAGVVANAFNVTVKNCVITNFPETPLFITSANCTIYNNTIYDTDPSYTYSGEYPIDETIQLNTGSDYGNVSYNTIYRTWIGIEVRASNYVTVAFNTINQTWYGIYAHYTVPYDQYLNVSYNNLTQNDIGIFGNCENCTYAFNNLALGKPLSMDPDRASGIVLGYSSSGNWGVYNNNTATTMPGAHARGFGGSTGLARDYVYQNNTVDGKPVVYYGVVNQPCLNNSVFDLSAGNASIMGFVGCTGLTVENNNFSSFQGVEAFSVTNSTFKNNFFTNGLSALALGYGSNNTVFNNTFYNTSTGLSLSAETGSNASYNNLTSNKFNSADITGTNVVFSNNIIVDGEGSWGVVAVVGTSTNLTLANNVLLSPRLTPSLPTLGYGAGITVFYFALAGGLTLYNNTVYNSSRQSVYLIDVYNASLVDNNFSRITYGDGYQDLYLTTGSSATLLNTSFNKSSIGFGDATSNLTCNWYLDVHAVDSCGFDAGGAVVNASNVNSSLVFSQTANSTGWIARQNVTEFFQNSSGVFNFTPHLFNGSASGLVGAVAANVSVDSTKTVTFLFADGSRCPGGGTAFSCSPCSSDGVCQACCASDPDCIAVTPSPAATVIASSAPAPAATPSPTPSFSPSVATTLEASPSAPASPAPSSILPSPSYSPSSASASAEAKTIVATGVDSLAYVAAFLIILVIVAASYYFLGHKK